MNRMEDGGWRDSVKFLVVVIVFFPTTRNITPSAFPFSGLAAGPFVVCSSRFSYHSLFCYSLVLLILSLRLEPTRGHVVYLVSFVSTSFES